MLEIFHKNGSMIYWIILQALVKQFEQLFVWFMCSKDMNAGRWSHSIRAFTASLAASQSPPPPPPKTATTATATTKTRITNKNLMFCYSKWPLKYGMLFDSNQPRMHRFSKRETSERANEMCLWKLLRATKKKSDFNSTEHNVCPCIDCVFADDDGPKATTHASAHWFMFLSVHTQKCLCTFCWIDNGQRINYAVVVVCFAFVYFAQHFGDVACSTCSSVPP